MKRLWNLLVWFWKWATKEPPAPLSPPGWRPFSRSCTCPSCRHEDLCQRTWTC